MSSCTHAFRSAGSSTGSTRPTSRSHLPPRQQPHDNAAHDDGLTRTALEARGIRTASDLIKAWPASSPTAGNGAARAQAALRNRGLPGLDTEHCELLVRILDEDVRLAPIWNWQARGVQAQDEHRRPGQRPRRLTEPRPMRSTP